MFFFFFFFFSLEVPGSSAGVVGHLDLDAGSVSSSVSSGHPVALAGVGCSVSGADPFFCTPVTGWDPLFVVGGSSLAGVVASVEWDVFSVAGAVSSGVEAGLSVAGVGFPVARAGSSVLGSFSFLAVVSSAVSSVTGSSLACSSFVLVLTAIAAWFRNI